MSDQSIVTVVKEQILVVDTPQDTFDGPYSIVLVSIIQEIALVTEDAVTDASVSSTTNSEATDIPSPTIEHAIVITE